MTGLLDFLRARLDDDERIARAVADHRGRPGELRWTQADPEREPGLIGDETGNVVTYHEGSPNEWQAAHIALHDPARVLREVAAKRLVVEWCIAAQDRMPAPAPLVGMNVLAALALPYAEHPDYDESWKP